MTRPINEPYQPIWRLSLVCICIVSLLLVIAWKIVDLQVINNSILQREGDARTVRNDVIVANRGNIVDRNGQPLAISSPVQSLWLNPKEVLQHPEQMPERAAAFFSIDINPEVMEKRIADSAQKEFLYIKRRMSPAESKAVLDLGIIGVYSQEEYRRFYPMGEAAVHLVGLTNGEDAGQEGMELAYDDWLSGVPGSRQVLKDRLGGIIREVKINAEAAPGKDLMLSIDSRLQFLAYKTLKEAVAMRGASGGTATLLDAVTGEVLAMVSQPSYNPNNLTSLDEGELTNRAIVSRLEPGSTVKTFTMTAALESGLFDTNSIVQTSPGYVVVDRNTIKDPVDYGPSTLARIIAKSSQVGASKVGLTIGPEPMLAVLARVGFGQSLSTGFPGEETGVLPNHARWSKADIASLAYGYGFQVTPLQLAQAYAIYANRGIRKQVSLVKLDAPVTGERVIAADLAETIVSMLKGVVSTDMGGTGVKANIPLYQVAGKTGTTWFYEAGKGYDQSNYISLFAGFVPADNPRIVAVITIHQPQGAEYGGGAVAAPVFAQIAAGAMRILNVTPVLTEPKVSEEPAMPAAAAELSMAQNAIEVVP
ncbi:MAG: peptidoglycan D,D-transpeptidase FtsI family protein [Pseudohongiellaceae bacterium]